jgi:hypothetical protein
VLQVELGGVGQVLILAATALAEVRAQRFDSLWRRLNYAEESGPRKPPLQFRYFCFHHFTPSYERDENDKIFHPGHPFAPEGNIANRYGQFVAQSQTHANELRRSGGCAKGHF